MKPSKIKHYYYYLSDRLTMKNLIGRQWSRAFNQFTIACELEMINAISAADIAFIMSISSTSAQLLSPLETKWLNASLLFLRMNYVKNV